MMEPLFGMTYGSLSMSYGTLLNTFVPLATIVACMVLVKVEPFARYVFSPDVTAVVPSAGVSVSLYLSAPSPVIVSEA